MVSKVNGTNDQYHDAEGRVYSFSDHYGFIDVAKISIKGRVYFDARSFEDNRYDDLHASGLRAGDRVVLDFGPKPGTCLYRAWRVRREGYSADRSAEKLPPRFDDEEGVICVLNDSHGFVRLPRFRGVTASFRKNNFEAYAGRRVAKLPDDLKLGLMVRFDAKRNPDKRSRTKWFIERLRFVDGVPPANAGTAALSCRSEQDDDVVEPGMVFGRRGSVKEVSPDHVIVKHHSGAAYLHASVVEKCLGVDVEDLREVLEVGSEVLFDADADSRQYGRGTWYVTRVEILGRSADKSQPVRSPVAAADAIARRLRIESQESDTAADTELHELQLEPRLRISVLDKEDISEDEEIEDDVRGACIARNRSEERTPVPSPVSHEGYPSLPSCAPKGKPSVSIYQNVPAVVASVTASGANCLVEQPDGTRRVKFATHCFYRNGAPVSGNLGRALGSGDLVTMDFMVGTTRNGKEVVHCDLAWQGKKPREVPRMSAEELLERLVAGGADDEEASGLDDNFLHETIDDDDLDALLGDSESTSGPDEVDAVPTCSWRIRNYARGTGFRTAASPKNGAQGTATEETLRYLFTHNEIPAFAKMILRNLAESHLPNSRVHLRNASTQTEDL